MVSRSSREARSAKREALRNAIVDRKLGSGRVAKSTKSKCKFATKKVSKPNSNKSLKADFQKSTKDSSKDIPKDSPKDSSKDIPQDSPKDISPETSSIKPEEVRVKKTSDSETTEKIVPVTEHAPLSPVIELQKATASSPEQFIDFPAEFTDDLAPIDTDVDNLTSFEELSRRYLDTPSPMSPVSPIDENKLCEPPIMSDEDLQTYLQEFEAVSSGADVPGATDSDYSDVSSMPVSPLLDEVRYMQDTRAPSPLCYTPDSKDDAVFDQPVSQEELKIDDYFNFINIADTSSDSISFVAEDTAPKRKVPFCVYQARNDVHPVSSTFNPKNRTLLAAWQTMAPDVQFGTRDAYVRAVLLAAASLTQRSLISGRARETMAPALGTSH